MNHIRARRLAAVTLATALISACTATPDATPTRGTTGSAPARAVIGPPVAECPATADTDPIVRQGTGHGVEMWAMLFARYADLRAREELKIVVRLTGGQEVTVTADGPQDAVVLPVWGPEWHGGSNFDRPGAEFGVGFTFPTGGCWRIRVVNEAGVGELVLRIADATARPS
ncbi:MAG: hypothetical protein HOV79_32005 [Hamadaea sp.]|nr:hypothetical protein [Hamadaea sp.]